METVASNGSLRTRVAPVSNEYVSHLREISSREGLDHDSILALVTVICGKGSSGTSSLQNHIDLVQCLIPKATVPIAAVFQCLGSMHVLPSALQRALFQWLVLVFDLVEDVPCFEATYDLLFQFLYYDSVRPAVAQLLCYLTTTRHVREFRVERLQKLCDRVLVFDDQEEDSLLTLLALYRFIAPQLFQQYRSSPERVWFKLAEQELCEGIRRVQSLRPGSPPLKRRRKFESKNGRIGNSEGVALPSTMSELCQSPNVRLCGSMSAVLHSPLLPHILSLCSEPADCLRFSIHLHNTLNREMERHVSGMENSQASCLLQRVVHLCTLMLELVPGVMRFLQDLLHHWNGEDYSQLVFQLLSLLPLMKFTELKHNYLEPLEHLMVTKTSLPRGRSFRHHVLRFLANLLHHWARHECVRHKHLAKLDLKTRSCARSSIFVDSVWNRDSVVSELDPIKTISSVIAYSERMVLSAIEIDQGHPVILHAAAAFYEVVTSLPNKYGLPILVVPRPQLVHLSLLHLEPSALSKTLPCYVRCLSNIRVSRTVERTIQLNTTVLDLCEALWKCRAFVNYANRTCQTKLFTTDRKYIKACGISNPVESKLSVFNHPSLLCYIVHFLKNAQIYDPTRHKDFRELIADKATKVQLLDYFQQHKLTGLAKFISTFIVLV